MGYDCDKYGKPGDGTTYDPPNAWAPAFERLLRLPKPDYFGNVVPTFDLDPPPAAPSAIASELAQLRRDQAVERAALMPAIEDENNGFFQVFERALGIEAAPLEKKLEIRRLAHIVGETVKFWSVKQKAKYNRPRPVQIAQDLAPPFCPGHPAYPSGHAGESYATALALIDALDRHPHLHGRMFDTAVTIGRHREVAGVHYPSDSECGRRLAGQFMAALRPDAGYRAKVAEARAELDALLGLPKPPLTPSAHCPPERPRHTFDRSNP